jgi:SAM-dependent methyltransferase
MIASIVGQIARPLIGLVAAGVLVRQCRKPAWLPGRLIAMQMNVSHRGLTDWALSHVTIEKQFSILDVGCGGGKTVQRLAERAIDGKVCGVDYSPASVATARRTNAAGIASGRVDIRQSTVSALPFDASSFDLATAIETHYYWPNLVSDLAEVRRVLRPAGTLIVVAEAYRGHGVDWLFGPVMRLLGGTFLTADEHRDAFTKAGYTEVQVFEERSKGWLCAVGRKGD